MKSRLSGWNTIKRVQSHRVLSSASTNKVSPLSSDPSRTGKQRRIVLFKQNSLSGASLNSNASPRIHHSNVTLGTMNSVFQKFIQKRTYIWVNQMKRNLNKLNKPATAVKQVQLKKNGSNEPSLNEVKPEVRQDQCKDVGISTNFDMRIRIRVRRH